MGAEHLIDISPWHWRARQNRDAPHHHPRVTVQVATKGRAKPLQGFVSSLLAQSYKAWELIIVDDTEGPDWLDKGDALRCLCEVVAGCGHRVRLVNTDALGIPRAYDRALELTTTELALRQEDDQVMEADYLERLVVEFDRIAETACAAWVGDGVGAVGGLSLAPHGRLHSGPIVDPAALKNYYYYGGNDFMDCGLIPDDDQRSPIISKYRAYRVYVLHGMWLYSCDRLREVGGFSKLAGRLGHREETEASLRLEWGGFSLWVCPQAVAYHLEAAGGSRSNPALVKALKTEDEERHQAWLQENIAKGYHVPIDRHIQRLR